MRCNVGIIDRTFRVLAGVLLIALAALGTIGIWGYIGTVALLTGVFGTCPAYALLGISTCAADTTDAKRS